jgi:hypothetical protein
MAIAVYRTMPSIFRFLNPDSNEALMKDILRPGPMVVACLLACVALAGCVVSAPPGYYAGEVVAVAPPPPQAEVIGVAPGPGYIWIGGFWNWVGGRHVWVGGHWEQGRPGYRWVPHRWEHEEHGWRMRPGHWEGERR